MDVRQRRDSRFFIHWVGGAPVVAVWEIYRNTSVRLLPSTPLFFIIWQQIRTLFRLLHDCVKRYVRVTPNQALSPPPTVAIPTAEISGEIRSELKIDGADVYRGGTARVGCLGGSGAFFLNAE